MSTTTLPGSPASTNRSARGGAPAVRRSTPMRRRRSRAAWGFAAPFVVLFLTFTVWPVVSSLAMSVTDIRSRDLQDPFNVNFVGIDNFRAVFADPLFWQAARNTGYFVVVGVPLVMFVALLIAVALNTGITRLSGFFRVGYFMPVVTSIVAVAVVWRFLLQPDIGIINTVLSWVGIHGPSWLQDPKWAMPALIMMAVWRGMGTLIVIFLAGLQGVPASLHEAAALDGANAWQRLRLITIPTIRPTLLFGAVLTGIGYLQFFEEPFVMTQGGPLNSTMSVSYYIFKQFGFGKYGVASAMSYVLFIAIVILTMIQFRVLTERDPRPRRRPRRTPASPTTTPDGSAR
jgi:multiple sugar transport system permease protein